VSPQPRGIKPGVQTLMNQPSGSCWPSLGLISGCSRRLPASATLPLSAAPDALRSPSSLYNPRQPHHVDLLILSSSKIASHCRASLTQRNHSPGPHGFSVGPSGRHSVVYQSRQVRTDARLSIVWLTATTAVRHFHWPWRLKSRDIKFCPVVYLGRVM
jgi:hypothetical protein